MKSNLLNGCRKLICVFLVLVAGSIQGQEERTAVTDSTLHEAWLDVDAEFDGLSIFLDQKKIGQTPLRNFSVSPGEHELIVTSPYWPAWDKPNYQVTFTAAAGEKYRFFAYFVERILVNSIPHGAQVYLDDKFIGETPTTCIKDIALEQTIMLKKEGYEPFTARIAELTGQAMVIRLHEDQEWAQAQEKAKSDKERKLRRRQRLMAASLGIATASGLATIHFRSQGNEEYSRYLTTAVPKQMETHFDQAQEYDRIASLTYALFEAGFILTGYYFLTSRP